MAYLTNEKLHMVVQAARGKEQMSFLPKMSSNRKQTKFCSLLTYHNRIKQTYHGEITTATVDATNVTMAQMAGRVVNAKAVW